MFAVVWKDCRPGLGKGEKQVLLEVLGYTHTTGSNAMLVCYLVLVFITMSEIVCCEGQIRRAMRYASQLEQLLGLYYSPYN